MPNKQIQSIQFPAAPYSASEIKKRHESGYGKVILECALYKGDRIAKHEAIVTSFDQKRKAIIWDMGTEVIGFFFDQSKEPASRESWKVYKKPYEQVVLKIRGMIDRHQLKLAA